MVMEHQLKSLHQLYASEIFITSAPELERA